MTVHTSELFRKADWAYRTPLLSKVANRASPRLRWLCPAPLLESANLDAMLQVYRAELAEEPAHLEFMMHSSELMPGGSPGFRTASDIERLYEYLEVLFEEASRSCTGVTPEGVRLSVRAPVGRLARRCIVSQPPRKRSHHSP